MRFTINEDIYSDLKNKIALETRHRGQTSLKKFLCDLFGIPRDGTLLHHLNGDWDDLRPKNLALILTINDGKSNILHKLIHSLTKKSINNKKLEKNFSLENMSVEQARKLLTDTLKNNLDYVMDKYPGSIILVQEKMKELNLDEQLLTNFTEQMKNEHRTRRTTMLQEDNLSKNMSIEDIAKKHNVSVKDIEKQVEKGIKVEKEHTSNEEQAKRIALDHLFEIPDYYDRLHKMEKGALKESLLPKDISIDGSLLVDDGVDIHEADLEDSITDWIYDQYGVGFQDYDYTVGDDGYVYVTNIKWDIDKTDSPLCVCKNCLMGIEAKEGPQKTHKVFFDDNDGVCQWCGEGGFYVLYEFGEGEDRYFDESLTEARKRPRKDPNYKHDAFDESLTEDTVKQGNHWVNKGKEGTHGKFKTKKAADAQRKAMFAQGYKEELNERFTNINGYYPNFCKVLDANLNKIGFNVDVRNFASVISIRVKKIEDTQKVTDYIKSLFDKYDIDPDITEDASEGSIIIDNLKQKTPLTVKATTMQPNHSARTQTQDNRKTITVESLSDDEYDDFELAGIYGGEMRYCPICGKQMEWHEDGSQTCPVCKKDAFILAQERRKRDKEELDEGIFKKSQEDKTLKNFKDMLAHLKDTTNTAQKMDDITDKELTKAAKKAVKKYGQPSQRTLDYLAQRAKERGFTEGLEDREYDCVLCGKHFTGWGNDPWPVAEDGRCCDKCNMEKVLPARINLLKSHKNESFEERVITPTDTLEGVKKDFIEDETNEFVRSFYTGGDHYVVYRSDKGLYTLIRSLPWDDFEIVFQTSNRKEMSDKIDEIYELNADYDLNL